MDATARALLASVLPQLASIAGLRADKERIAANLRLALEPTFRAIEQGSESVHSTLTAGDYPVELGLMLDAGRPIGIKHTVDLFPIESREVRFDREVLRAVLEPLSGARAIAQFGNLCARVADVASADLRSIYLATSYGRDLEPRTKLYLVGTPGALRARVVHTVAAALGVPSDADRVVRAMDAVGLDACDTIGLALNRDRIAAAKCYLVKPYMHAGLVRRLAHALDLSAVRAVALLRWYRLFVGSLDGIVGLHGFGVEIASRKREFDLEAYSFPGFRRMEALHSTIGKLWRASELRSLWDRCPAPAPYLAGAGVQITGSGRLDSATVYWGVAAADSERALRSLPSANSISVANSGTIQHSQPIVSSSSRPASESAGSSNIRRNVTTVNPST